MKIKENNPSLSHTLKNNPGDIYKVLPENFKERLKISSIRTTLIGLKSDNYSYPDIIQTVNGIKEQEEIIEKELRDLYHLHQDNINIKPQLNKLIANKFESNITNFIDYLKFKTCVIDQKEENDTIIFSTLFGDFSVSKRSCNQKKNTGTVSTFRPNKSQDKTTILYNLCLDISKKYHNQGNNNDIHKTFSDVIKQAEMLHNNNHKRQ
ncbi:hypothetical protein KJ855_01135 [Patescibacteria group bacterium]|nr:hypothetical protein [Patescibacteria group bacterium]